MTSRQWMSLDKQESPERFLASKHIRHLCVSDRRSERSWQRKSSFHSRTCSKTLLSFRRTRDGRAKTRWTYNLTWLLNSNVLYHLHVFLNDFQHSATRIERRVDRFRHHLPDDVSRFSRPVGFCCLVHEVCRTLQMRASLQYFAVTRSTQYQWDVSTFAYSIGTRLPTITRLSDKMTCQRQELTRKPEFVCSNTVFTTSTLGTSEFTLILSAPFPSRIPLFV
jgi:hypothetical protein